jgi:hypothetical protein
VFDLLLYHLFETFFARKSLKIYAGNTGRCASKLSCKTKLLLIIKEDNQLDATITVY